MNKDDILCMFHSQYSPWGLRYRASKLPPKNIYRKLLELLSYMMEGHKINKTESMNIVSWAREGQWGKVMTLLNVHYSIEELKKIFGVANVKI